MRPSTIKTKLARNEPSLVTCCHLTDPSIYELVSLMGFDGIWMDMEHHGYSVQTAGELMRAARVGTADVLVRPAKGEFMRMGRMLEAGAQGIMYPRCDSPEEAAEVVKWAKFAPLGKRGFDGGNPDMPYCTVPIDQYVRIANEQTFIVIQIEEEHALNRAEEIASVEGVDAIMLGPADFSILSGVPGQFNSDRVQKAIRKVAVAARNAGKHWACTAGSVQNVEQMIELGARILCHNADIIMIKSALERMQTDFAPMGFTFNNQIKARAASYLQTV